MVGFETSAKIQRIFFISVPSFYLAFLAAVAIYRSADRRSVLTQSVFKDSPTTAASEALSGVESKVQMRDFVRYEMSHGKIGWEIRASDAKLFANDGVSHISNARMIIHRERGEAEVRIFAKSAQLETVKSEVQRALLTGDVKIEEGDSLTMTTDTAEYDLPRKLVRSPSRVAVLGSGFELFGDSMEFPLEEQQLSLFGNVVSRFEPGLKAPDRLGEAQKK